MNGGTPADATEQGESYQAPATLTTDHYTIQLCSRFIVAVALCVCGMTCGLGEVGPQQHIQLHRGRTTLVA